MKYKIFVFDFDGTLVDSVNLKVDAYFKIFHPYCISDLVISSVLKEFPDLNRYETIQLIIDNGKVKANPTVLSELYSSLVMDEILKAPNLEFATEILDFLLKGNYSVYLSSNTPQVALADIIEKKNWKCYFEGIFGYPHVKDATLKKIINSGNFLTDSVLVIGDGESDKIAAELNATDFFKVESNSLFQLINFLEIKELIDA